VKLAVMVMEVKEAEEAVVDPHTLIQPQLHLLTEIQMAILKHNITLIGILIQEELMDLQVKVDTMETPSCIVEETVMMENTNSL